MRHFKSPWTREISKVLDIYNNDKHRSTGFTPKEAMEPKNKDDVRINLEINRKRGRRYDPIEKGDRVRVVRKKEINEKENNPPSTTARGRSRGWKARKRGGLRGCP